MRSLLAALVLTTQVWTCVCDANVIVYQDNAPTDFNTPGANSVRRTINVEVDLSATDLTITTSTIPRTTQEAKDIASGPLADINAVNGSVKKSLADVKTAGKLELDCKVTVSPNPIAKDGYQVSLQSYSMRSSVNVLSDNFFDYEAVPISPGLPDSVFLGVLYSKVAAKKFVQFELGSALSNSWTDPTVIQVLDSFDTTTTKDITFTISVPYNALLDNNSTTAGELVEAGKYLFVLDAIMQPYAKQTIEEKANKTHLLAQTEITYRYSFLQEISVFLQGTSTLHQSSAVEKTNLKANQTFLNGEITAITKDVDAYLTTLSNDATATDADIALITQIKTDIADLIKNEKKLLAAV